jgi:hypothetical protein
MTDLSKEELDARLAAIKQGPWSEGLLQASQRLAPVGRILPSLGSMRPIALEALALSASTDGKADSYPKSYAPTTELGALPMRMKSRFVMPLTTHLLSLSSTNWRCRPVICQRAASRNLRARS